MTNAAGQPGPTEPLEIVHTFLDAAEKRDYDTALALVTDDVEYHNIPIPPAYGPQGVKDTLEALLSMCQDFEVVIHREVAQGDIVMNERTDRFLHDGKWAELPVAGVFVVRDGRIAIWHDYFDLDTIMKQLAPSE
jgi:limonene-1,2-epoxide hydrolase